MTVFTEVGGIGGSAVSFAYLPGIQSGCAATDVGFVDIQVNDDESVTIRVANNEEIAN